MMCDVETGEQLHTNVAVVQALLYTQEPAVFQLAMEGARHTFMTASIIGFTLADTFFLLMKNSKPFQPMIWTMTSFILVKFSYPIFPP